MNKNFWINKIKEKEIFDSAFIYALAYRINQDSFCNFIELDFYRQNKENLREEIEYILDFPEEFQTETCFSFYLPKDNMFFRRMIHTPFKDLVIKFMFVKIFVDFLDFTIIPNCFSYRKSQSQQKNLSKNKKNKEYLYKHFFDGVVDFETWQLEQVENFSCLLKTDISSFYDSISHKYLITAICEELNITEENQFMRLFSKTLKYKVCYYSITDGSVNDTYNSSGIPIGNEAEGFLANIFLKKADEALLESKVTFGRYVDDYRIFSNSKKDALKASMILQESLLKIGINLNSSKTKLIEAKEEIISVINQTKPSVEEYIEEIELKPIVDKTNLRNEVKNHEHSGEKILDDDKIELHMPFNQLEEINTLHKVKIFCKQLNSLKPGSQVNLEDLDKYLTWLEKLSLDFPRASKFYAWLFVKFIVHFEEYSIQLLALRKLFNILESENTHNYLKTRIIHHLVKPRRGSLTYIQRSTIHSQLNAKFLEILEGLILSECIALQLNCIYAYFLLVKDSQKVKSFVSHNLRRPIVEPIKYALYQISYLEQDEAADVPSFEELLNEEEDIIRDDF